MIFSFLLHQQTIEKQSGLFSDDEANPLRDYWHVIVPYCSSDTWAGTGYSQGSGYRDSQFGLRLQFNYRVPQKGYSYRLR